jgi:hypothetical protein
MKTTNEYVMAVGETLYRDTSKAVFAAIAVSALTQGGDAIDEVRERLVEEWWVLFDNGIVPQRPLVSRARSEAR